MNDNNSVVANSRHVLNQYIATIPESEIITITFVTINSDISLTTIRVDEDNSNACLTSKLLDLRACEVIGNRLEDPVV